MIDIQRYIATGPYIIQEIDAKLTLHYKDHPTVIFKCYNLPQQEMLYSACGQKVYEMPKRWALNYTISPMVAEQFSVEEFIYRTIDVMYVKFRDTPENVLRYILMDVKPEIYVVANGYGDTVCFNMRVIDYV